jgi:manganese transport protein
MGLDPTRTLVISQVLLSFGLPFAVIPLVFFTRRRDVMGSLVNHHSTTVILVIIAVFIVGLNFYLLYATMFGG